MFRDVLDRTENIGCQFREAFGQRFEQEAIAAPVNVVEIICSVCERALQQHCAAIVERVGARRARLYPRYFDG